MSARIRWWDWIVIPLLLWIAGKQDREIDEEKLKRGPFNSMEE